MTGDNLGLPPTETSTKRAVLTKTDLIENIARVVDIPRKEAATIVELILDSMVHALDTGGKVEIRGFGSFRTRPRRARIGRNPRTGATMKVPARKIPYFRASKELRDLIQGNLNGA
jgi:integration host factor subunit beta